MLTWAACPRLRFMPQPAAAPDTSLFISRFNFISARSDGLLPRSGQGRPGHTAPPAAASFSCLTSNPQQKIVLRVNISVGARPGQAALVRALMTSLTRNGCAGRADQKAWPHNNQANKRFYKQTRYETNEAHHNAPVRTKTPETHHEKIYFLLTLAPLWLFQPAFMPGPTKHHAGRAVSAWRLYRHAGARALAPKLQEKFKQTVIVDNKAGAMGNDWRQAVKRAAHQRLHPAGNVPCPLVIAIRNSLSSSRLRPARTLITTVAVQAPNVLAARQWPHRSKRWLMCWRPKSQPAGSVLLAGNGSSDHLSAELFWLQSAPRSAYSVQRRRTSHFWIRLGGQVDAVRTSTRCSSIFRLLQTACAGNCQRQTLTAVARNTYTEAGVKDAVAHSWQGGGPQRLPADVKNPDTFSAVSRAGDPLSKQKFVDVGFELVGNTPEHHRLSTAGVSPLEKIIETRKITAD